MTADSRQSPIAIAWTDDGLIGRLRIDGELWAAVEWSEKRQRWCIEDPEGQCLRHTASIRGAAESKEAAVALAEAMIRDRRMPTPKEAKRQAAERRRVAREKRQQQPAQIRRREQDRRYVDAISDAWRAKAEEDKAPPLYEALADAFDFADPELWKSNSFAALRPRLTLHVRRAVAELEQELAFGAHHRRFRHSQATTGLIEAKLARAREILSQLVSSSNDVGLP